MSEDIARKDKSLRFQCSALTHGISLISQTSTKGMESEEFASESAREEDLHLSMDPVRQVGAYLYLIHGHRTPVQSIVVFFFFEVAVLLTLLYTEESLKWSNLITLAYF